MTPASIPITNYAQPFYPSSFIIPPYALLRRFPPSALHPGPDRRGKRVCAEVNGQDEAQEMKRREVSLPPGLKVKLDDLFCSITSLPVGRVPEARLGIRCEKMEEAHIVTPQEWEHIWVYGMDIFMTGYATCEEMGQRAALLLPNSKTFQYERIHVKNPALPESRLKPVKKLMDTAM